MTNTDLNTLKELSENFSKGDENGINYLASDSTTYSEERYEELEQELEQKINTAILEFKNKYLVLPTLKVEDGDKVNASLKINRTFLNTTSLYKGMLEHQNDHQKSNQ